jgi:hypothetical protein
VTQPKLIKTDISDRKVLPTGLTINSVSFLFFHGDDYSLAGAGGGGWAAIPVFLSLVRVW